MAYQVGADGLAFASVRSCKQRIPTIMKAFVTCVLAAALLACVSSVAQAENTQQEKMKTCNADAKTKNLKGDDRKAFMKTCLSGK
jgi:hypothetical protein